jgi:hypothetical protein
MEYGHWQARWTYVLSVQLKNDTQIGTNVEPR